MSIMQQQNFKDTCVSWDYPAPRSGWAGLIDRFIGPGATQAELRLQLLPAVMAAFAAPLYAMTVSHSWTSLQLGLMAFLGFDCVGGILTNATATAKRWYHRPEQGWRQHLAFVGMHIVQISLVALLFRESDWIFLAIVSGYLIIASIAILFSPLYLQRPIALGLYGVALLGDRYLLSPTLGLEWFLPFLMLKLLVSHLLKEAPYRSETDH